MYRFNLQVLLDYRKRVDEGIQIELSHIQRAFEREKKQLIAFEEEKNHYKDELAKREEKRIDVEEGMLYRDYLKGRRIKIGKQRAGELGNLEIILRKRFKKKSKKSKSMDIC